MGDYASAAALGTIAGAITARNHSDFVDRVFAERDKNYTIALLSQDRNALRQALTEWRNHSIDQGVQIARLDALVATREREIAERNLTIANMKAEIFNRDQEIASQESLAVREDRRIRELLIAFRAYRERLGIVSDEHDTAPL